MAIGDISLTAAARGNLISLQETSNLLQNTQLKLATGKKVNDATDNATAFFQSQGFLQRAGDFSKVRDSVATALETVRAASNAIDSITNIVEQLQGLTTSALQATGDAALRQSYASQFNSLVTQINELVDDASFNGTNLIGSTAATLNVNFNEDATNELNIANTNLTAGTAGLDITLAAGNFTSTTQINTAANDLTAALTELRSAASSFGTNISLIQTRQEFTDGLINVLQTASDNLVLADTNEEGANLQALQARLQLGVVSLGISGQEAQAILRLF